MARNTCASFQCPQEPEITVGDNYTPAIYSDPALAERAAKVFIGRFGADQVVQWPPSMGGDDFARYARALKVPGLMFRLGSTGRCIPPTMPWMPYPHCRRESGPWPCCRSNCWIAPESHFAPGVVRLCQIPLFVNSLSRDLFSVLRLDGCLTFSMSFLHLPDNLSMRHIASWQLLPCAPCSFAGLALGR